MSDSIPACVRAFWAAGPVQGQEALRRGGRPGGRHGPRQDQPRRPRAQRPGLRRHGAPRHGRAPRQAPHRRRRVQEVGQK